MKCIRPHSKGVLIEVWVQPNASKSEIVGLHGDLLKLKIKAPPVDGKANDEVQHFFSRQLSVPQSHIDIIKGTTSRHKTVLVSGANAELVLKIIQPKLKIRD